MTQDILREILNDTLNKYALAKSRDFASNTLADNIRKTYPERILKCCAIDESIYKVYGSPGKGKWAEIPWIAICDRRVTTSAQKGYDVVYLFVSDMSGVYISLNQGWTYYRERFRNNDAINNIKKVSSYWKNKLSGAHQNYINEIDLKTNNPLGIGYEHGHILGKFYDKDNLPDESTLVNDLKELMLTYKILSGQLINGFENTNQLIIDGIPIEWNDKEYANLVKNHSKNREVNLEFEEVQNLPRSNKFEERKNGSGGKDYSDQSEKQKLLGYLGEKYVLEYEKARLRGRKNKDGRLLSEMIEHVSVTKGDSEGYDILSYDENGEDIFIEVKTTIGGIKTPFYITANELGFSRLNKNKYCIYRLYDFNEKNYTNKAYCIKGSEIEELLQLDPINYRVKIKSSNI